MTCSVTARRRVVLGALGLAALLCACPPPPDRPFPVEVGTGEGGLFVPLAEGDPLILNSGFQGGQHVYVSVRAQGLLQPSDPTVMVSLSLKRASDGATLSQPFSQRLTLSDSPGLEGTAERTGMILFVSTPSAVGQQVKLRAELQDEDGAISGAEYTGVLQWAEQ